MQKTPFAGLTELDPSDPLSEDGFSFQSINPSITDYLLRLAVRDHKHDAHAALANPSIDPVVTVGTSGGTIPSGTTLTVGYTLIDAQGGETALNATPQVITTQDSISTPTDSPTLVADTTSGSLLAGSYSYAVTITDAGGGETALGPASTLVIPAGSATNEIEVSGLDALVTASGGSGWRLWRSVNGADWALINDGATASVTDDGTLCADRGVDPPIDTTGTTNATNKLDVTVPTGQPAGTVSFRIYASEDGTFSSPALLGEYPIADAGAVKEYLALTFLTGAPPSSSLAMPGAAKITADEVILSWLPPVADATALAALTGMTTGAVVVQESDNSLHIYGSDHTWHAVGGGGGGGGAAVMTDITPGGGLFATGWSNAGGSFQPLKNWYNGQEVHIQGTVKKSSTPTGIEELCYCAHAPAGRFAFEMSVINTDTLAVAGRCAGMMFEDGTVYLVEAPASVPTNWALSFTIRFIKAI